MSFLSWYIGKRGEDYMSINKFISILLEHKLQFVGYFILVILTTFFSIGISYLTYTIVDLAQTGTKQDIIYFGGLIIVYFISYGIVKYYRMYLQSKLLNHSIQKIKATLIQNITNLSYFNYIQETNSNYVSMIVNDCATIEEKYYKNILELISDISILILGVGTLIYLNYYVLVWILLMLLVMLKVSKYYEEKLNSKAIYVSQMNSKTISKIKDCLYSFDFTRQYSDRLKILNQFKNSNKELSKSKIELDRNMAKAESFSVATGWLMSLGIFVIAAYFVVCNQLSVATMMAIAQLMNCVSNPIISCMSYVNQIKSTKGIRNTILPLLEKNNINQNQSSLDSLNQGITFKDVDFSYNDQIQVLNHINISFEKGKKYLMIGGSGSGKSTLLKLINKSYENYSGEIYFDQTNYKNISVEELYEHLSYVPQNIYLLNETIENNVTLFNHYSKE